MTVWSGPSGSVKKRGVVSPTKKWAVVVGTAVFAFACGDGTAPPSERVPITIHVPGDYATVQAAHDAARTGDTILVAPGTYVGQITISKAITLASRYVPTGDEQFITGTILDGGGAAFVIRIANGAEPDAPIIGVSAPG